MDTIWKIEFYKDNRKNKPVGEFLKGLNRREKLKAYRMIDLLEELGTDICMPHARKIQKNLFELRPGNIRVMYFIGRDNTFILVYAFRKKGRKTPENDIVKAIKRRQKYFERNSWL